MTKVERKYLENYEVCFEQLRSAYSFSQDENKKLKVYIEFLKELCHNNFVDIPVLNEPIPF